MTQVDKISSQLVFGTEPYEYQRDIVEQTWQDRQWGLFMEMGTGKSKILIDTFCNLYLAGRVDTILYVAKKGELSNFQTYELSKHKPEHIKCYAHIYRGYVRKDDLTRIKHMLTPTPALRVLSINIESLRNMKGKPYLIALKYLRSSPKTMLVVDESTTLKDRRSSQHKAIKALRTVARYIRIMTGTVIPHNPVDVFCQAQILSGKRQAMGYGGVTAFKSEFIEYERVYMGNRSYLSPTGSKNLDRLQRKIRRIGTVMMKEDCLDLPDKVYTRHAVPLTEEQEKLYNELVDFHLAQIGGETIECLNALSVLLRLHQVVCGQLKTETGYHRIPNARYAATKEVVDSVLENEDKIVLWSHFREATAGLVEYLGQDHNLVHLEGGLSIDERAERIDRFKTDQDCRIFVGNPQSSGFGLTLTEAHTSLYYSNSDNYEHRLQSEDRIHRIGQSKKCLYIDFHTPGTVEDAVLDRNRMKGLQRQRVMGRNEFAQLIQLRS